jgi:hypothetical protein
MADSAYIGPEADTAPIRRITPSRVNQAVHDARINEEVARRRNPVEWFFGRLWRSWALLRHEYRWDHAHFDDDNDICCLLTNELIRAAQLAERDHDFYRQVVTRRHATHEAVQRKRVAEQHTYKQNKLARVSALADD